MVGDEKSSVRRREREARTGGSSPELAREPLDARAHRVHARANLARVRGHLSREPGERRVRRLEPLEPFVRLRSRAARGARGGFRGGAPTLPRRRPARARSLRPKPRGQLRLRPPPAPACDAARARAGRRGLALGRPPRRAPPSAPPRRRGGGGGGGGGSSLASARDPPRGEGPWSRRGRRSEHPQRLVRGEGPDGPGRRRPPRVGDEDASVGSDLGDDAPRDVVPPAEATQRRLLRVERDRRAGGEGRAHAHRGERGGGVGLEFSWGEVRVGFGFLGRGLAGRDAGGRGDGAHRLRRLVRLLVRERERRGGDVVGVVGGAPSRAATRGFARRRGSPLPPRRRRLFPPPRVRLLVSLGASRRRSRPWSCSARACAWAAARWRARGVPARGGGEGRSGVRGGGFRFRGGAGLASASGGSSARRARGGRRGRPTSPICSMTYVPLEGVVTTTPACLNTDIVFFHGSDWPEGGMGGKGGRRGRREPRVMIDII